ncbi:MAG: Uma2 family endonuclease [Tychonema bourrellyi B0820]|uniref:Uma2 family endonuclease n=1 Tax=Tychonema bourrellyi FEM_GT703 TaxID=2040638 RepID=A0A2G4F528_9CYAN|nr:Uma2 family endonuclease [Tychonema bourrellyi]MDQ2097754.1 Uma2 family endonuclease [Tychonema bourrellyi B0820]PHX56894.1 Uma2 family endonuclease [Tychonema bourrellyi FEM_GT703]
MTAQLLEEIGTLGEQRFVLPSYYSWEQFEALESLMADSSGLRITYLDGWIEFMTLGEAHESFKKAIAILLEAYFCEFGITFFPVGSATRRNRAKDVSFEPDESYYIGKKKEHPDLAVEVTITSGSTNKLAKYLRLRIPEVWFWENNQLSVYGLREDNYEQVSRSELLPELDLELLVRCVLMPSIIEARQEFIKGIRRQ